MHSEVNMRGQSAVDNHRAPCPAPRQSRQLLSFDRKDSVRMKMKTFHISLNMFPLSGPDLSPRGRRWRMQRQMG